MDTRERSQDIYEQIPAYPKPPLIPLPAPADIDTLLAEKGMPPRSRGHRISKVAMALTGFMPFLRRLPHTVENLMRRSDLRGGWLFAPLISATLALEDDPRVLSPLQRAATLLVAARSFHDDLFAGRLKPDTYRGQALEMGQYANFFATSLIVEGKRPRIFKSAKLSQITVAVGDRLYLLEVGHLGVETTTEQVVEALEELVRRTRERGPADEAAAPGLLTSAGHLTQCQIFTELGKIEANRASLEAIRRSFLTLCLDLESSPTSHAEAAREGHTGRLANRWWHSSLQLVVYGNARACAICNFSAYLDGNTMMRGAAELQRRAAACALGAPGSNHQPSLTPPIELEWSLKPEYAQMARRDLAPVLDKQQVTFEITGVGTDFFVTHELEAIPTFILALQMTARRLIPEPAEITQFLTMSRYRCMDLTTAMVTTPEVSHFVDAMIDDTVERAGALALLREAVSSQQQKCRLRRRYLPLEDIIGLLIVSRRGLARTYTRFIYYVRAMLLFKIGAIKRQEREILVSHPKIYPEIPLVGRPGVRLPYVKYFGLHYQIWADKIVLTLMPAINWQIPNAQLVADLEASLRRLQALVA